uniref:Uncharacterized protein n=1 Tax=Lactuca sativa TaxID=4236 RepID=A0A9R1VBD1_LACSA|nr:hypothetical protein LSAT_V11C600320380 [Lactuca sativa]
MNLGIIENCLCVFPCDGYLLIAKQEHYVPNKRTLCRDMLFYKTKEYICAPIYMESLVSPYVNGRPKRKIQESNSKKSCKRDPMLPVASG